MSTIKDIAKMAGVSHGTVSNVLNGRGNVSVKKIKLVEDAAQKLGYRLNAQAKILKEGFAKTISIVLPNITSEQYHCLYERLFSDLVAQGYELTLYITRDAKERELQFIQKIATKRDSAVIVVSCLDSAESYYQMLQTPKNKIIFVYRKPACAEQFISLDFEQAGRDIADAVMTKQYHRIGLFSNSIKNAHSYALKQGLLNRFDELKYAVQLYHAESVPSDGTYNLAFSFFNQPNEPFEVIITSDIERAHYVRSANYFGHQAKCPPIYTLSNEGFRYDDNFYQYHMNYGLLSQNIVNLVEGDELIAVKNKGYFFFADNFDHQPITTPCKTLKLLILPSPSTEALRKLLPHFKKKSGIDVTLDVRSFDEMYCLFDELDQHPDVDIIRIDMASLPWFAPSILRPLKQLNLDLTKLLNHYAKQVTERFTYLNGEAYAVPFDPSIQMLFYRQDLFDDPLIKRQYFEKYRRNLDVPTDFEQFTQISEFFNRQHNVDSPIEFGGGITLGNTEIIASEFLLRYYANGGQLIEHDQIVLDKSIAMKTLVELAKFMSSAHHLEAAWWQASVEQFERGDLAMLIIYMNLFSYISTKNILPLIGCAPVPGNRPLFGGGSLGMSRYSDKITEVSQFFDWIFSKEISEQIALLGGSVAQDCLFQNQKIMHHYPWFNLVQQNYVHGVRENQLNNGQSINLRQVERIIGEHITLWLTAKCDSELIIDYLNHELKRQLSSICS
ncbi:DNA-binding LacI/PurR family transcriptional regulator [Orbus hercynius]|uniref:DNA-binding LacI/PurR family transcriptional regulator n=1 Tax=Orbus hercynius TaxID=593135 RepID=A0A495RIY7_9GAMM|nr:extracellular solute-binding protein [Orbus hercynius]RKS87126.1 DNA-binding LacI/PurR family transcriptional regulator [Orbus hercynius]